jgi:hypothetical protein
MGDEAGASELAGMLQRDAEALSTLTRQVLDAPSALFWRTPEHVKLALVTRESHARLKSHEDMLKLLSKEEILRLIAREAENRDTTHD